MRGLSEADPHFAIPNDGRKGRKGRQPRCSIDCNIQVTEEKLEMQKTAKVAAAQVAPVYLDLNASS